MIKKYLSVCLASLLIVPTVSFSASSESPLLSLMNQKDNTPMTLCNPALQLVPKTISENSQSLNYSIDVRYPQIVGANLTPAATHFNQKIRAIVDKQIAAFKEQVNNHAGDTSLPHANNYLKINYEKTDACSQSQHAEYASVRFGIEMYILGDAHPENKIQSFNYDLGHDKVLALSDLFNLDSHYLSVIANYCTQQLLARKLPADLVKTGAAAKSDNYQVWSSNMGNNLVITFNAGQVAPRVDGAQEVVVPTDVIKNILNHQSACTMSVMNCDGT